MAFNHSGLESCTWQSGLTIGVCDILSTCSLGVVFGFVSNQRVSISVSSLENTASSGLQDGVNYLNDTLNVREKEGRKGGREERREGEKKQISLFFFLGLQQVTFIATDQFSVATDRIANNIQSM